MKARRALRVDRKVNIMSSSIRSKSNEQRLMIRPIGVRSKNDKGNRRREERNRWNNLREPLILVSNIRYVPRNSKITRTTGENDEQARRNRKKEETSMSPWGGCFTLTETKYRVDRQTIDATSRCRSSVIGHRVSLWLISPSREPEIRAQRQQRCHEEEEEDERDQEKGTSANVDEKYIQFHLQCIERLFMADSFSSKWNLPNRFRRFLSELVCLSSRLWSHRRLFLSLLVETLRAEHLP